MLLNKRFSPFFSHPSPHSFPVHSNHPSSPTISSCLYLSCLSSIYLHPLAVMFTVHVQTPFLSACRHFLPSTLFSLTSYFLCCPPFSPPFCHPPFQPTYSTFALDTHLYFFSFVLDWPFPHSFFIRLFSWYRFNYTHLAPVYAKRTCTSTAHVQYATTSASWTTLIIPQVEGMSQRMISTLPKVPTRQVFPCSCRLTRTDDLSICSLTR